LNQKSPGKTPGLKVMLMHDEAWTTAVVRATRLSCQNAGKAQKFTPVRGSSGESRIKAQRSGARTPDRRLPQHRLQQLLS
jgi:hypothetical protein